MPGKAKEGNDAREGKRMPMMPENATEGRRGRRSITIA